MIIAKIIETIKADMGKIDLVVYSLASPRRTDPDTGEVYSPTLKQIGKSFITKILNTPKGVIVEVSFKAVNDAKIKVTIVRVHYPNLTFPKHNLFKTSVYSETKKKT